MKQLTVNVITPVGPGHEKDSEGCAASVRRAWAFSPGPFTDMQHCIQPDHAGELGCAAAKNKAIAESRAADWYFFIDADDEACPEAFERFRKAYRRDESLTAVFGAVFTKQPNSRKPYIIPENVWPLDDWDKLLKLGAFGTLSMGCFFRADLVKANPFDSELGIAEDFNFYLRALHGQNWTKIKEPLVMIHRDTPSSQGPRGYQGFKWREACQVEIDKWKSRHLTVR